MRQSHDDMVALVTGAASGIGFALCRELHARGATVHAADLNEAGLAQLKQACGERLITTQLNVADEVAVQTWIENAATQHGHIDYLFNNAGIVVGGDFEMMNRTTWQKIIDINLWGVIHGSQYGYALMLRQGHGHLINIASTAGVMPIARSTAYATTKHAVVGLSTSLREEGRAHGIRVSVVIPGLVDTRIFSRATNVGGHDYDAAMRKVPFNKISPQQAARAILTGVAHNHQFIVFPTYNRLIVGFARLFPGFMGWLISRST